MAECGRKEINGRVSLCVSKNNCFRRCNKNYDIPPIKALGGRKTILCTIPLPSFQHIALKGCVWVDHTSENDPSRVRKRSWALNRCKLYKTPRMLFSGDQVAISKSGFRGICKQLICPMKSNQARNWNKENNSTGRSAIKTSVKSGRWDLLKIVSATFKCVGISTIQYFSFCCPYQRFF